MVSSLRRIRFCCTFLKKKIQFKKISINFKLVKLLKDDEEEGDTGELKDTFVFKLNDFLKWSSIALKISPLK